MIIAAYRCLPTAHPNVHPQVIYGNLWMPLFCDTRRLSWLKEGKSASQLNISQLFSSGTSLDVPLSRLTRLVFFVKQLLVNGCIHLTQLKYIYCKQCSMHFQNCPLNRGSVECKWTSHACDHCVFCLMNTFASY